MSNTNLKLVTVLILGSVLALSCTKADRSDDFPKGDAPAVPGGFTNSNQIEPGSLVGYWNFNGDLKDSVSGATANGSNVSFADGIKGKAYQGGGSSFATFNPAAALQTLHSFTIAFWMNTSTNGTFGIFTIANTGDFWGSIDMYTDGDQDGKAIFKVHINNSAVPWSGQFPDTRININQWVQITATYDAATSKLNIYQNGVSLEVNSAGNPAKTVGPILHGSDPNINPVTPYGNLTFVNATAAAFGAFQFTTTPSLTPGVPTPPDWAHNYGGKLDEFRIYNKALTAQEVSALNLLESQGR